MQVMSPSHGWRAAMRGGRLLFVIAALTMTTIVMADDGPPSQQTARQPPAPQPATAVVAPAEVTIANREIMTMRAEVYGATPADRAQAVQDRVAELVRRGGPAGRGLAGARRRCRGDADHGGAQPVGAAIGGLRLG